MSMFRVSGQVMKVYRQERTDRDTGEVQAQTRVQLLGEVPTRDGGDTKLDFIDLRAPEPLVEPLKRVVGKNISLPVGVFAPAKGRLVWYVPTGAKVESQASKTPA